MCAPLCRRQPAATGPVGFCIRQSGSAAPDGCVIQGVEEPVEGHRLLVVAETHGRGERLPPPCAAAAVFHQEPEGAVGAVTGEDLVGGDLVQVLNGVVAGGGNRPVDVGAGEASVSNFGSESGGNKDPCPRNGEDSSNDSARCDAAGP